MLWRPPGQVIGVDIGASAIRLLELKRRRRGVGVRASATAPLPEHAITDGEIRDESTVVTGLASLVSSWPTSTRRVAVGLTGRDAFVTRLLLPRLTARELRAAIRWEAKAHLPFDDDEVALDYQAMDGTPSDHTRMVVVLAAARRTTIERLRSLLARAGLQLAIVDIAAFALHRACRRLGMVGGGEVVLLLHIGTRATTVCLGRGGDAPFVRDLAIGGEAWTAALAREARCTREEAEVRKRRLHLQPDDSLAVVTESFAAELARTVAFARDHASAPTPQRVVLSGGGARLRGLDDAIAARMSCRIDVFGGLPDLGPAWALAAGLALRGVPE